MKKPRSGTRSLISSALLMSLTACGGSVPVPLFDNRGAAVNLLIHAKRGLSASWTALDAKAQDLLYVGNVNDVTIYSYPGRRLEGRLKGFDRTEGLCNDSKGDVFITNLVPGRVDEYRHGEVKRIAELDVTSPYGCSTDPTTGDLAVTSLAGTVVVFKGARGKPETFTGPSFGPYYYCSYDDQGNLFVDGQSKGTSEEFELGELPRGGTSVSRIGLHQNIAWPGGVQWYHKYVAVGDQESPIIYTFKISRGKGTVVSSTPLGSPADDVLQFWIQDDVLIAPNLYFSRTQTLSDVLFYDYGVGGLPRNRISKAQRFPRGVVVSLASGDFERR
jgi:hypothetical protein